jgi:beta-barrel assembly-enhancing protease
MIRGFTLFMAIIWATPPAYADGDMIQIEAFRGLIEQDLRLASVGYRLANGSRAHCPVLARNPGWVIHDIAQYSNARVAALAFPSSEPISVAAVVANGPAARVGIQANDGLTSIAGKALNWPSQAKKGASYDRVAAVNADIAAAIQAKDSLPLTLKRGTMPVSLNLLAPLICASTFQISTSGGINAGADGTMVSVSIDLARFAETEIELASIVAHELAHNLLQHRAKLDAAKVSRGLGSLFGKSKNAILQTEIEADQLSIWLLANAGYDPNEAITFWQRFSKKHGAGIFTAGTHLRWKNRIKIMEAEIAALNTTDKDANGYAPPLLLKLRTGG